MSSDEDDEESESKTLEDMMGEDHVSEENVEEYSKSLSEVSEEPPLEHFKVHRQMFLGRFLPIKLEKFISEAEQEKVQDILDQIKSIGFFSPAYIDNLILYFEVMKAPVLDQAYLTQIIDSYVKPDPRVQGKRPFEKFAIGYFCHELHQYGASISATSQMMEECFIISGSEVENSIKSYKQSCKFIKADMQAQFVADLIALLVLYETEFVLDKYIRIFGTHHHSETSKAQFWKAYDQYCKHFYQTYIPLIQDAFQKPPIYLDQIILPELKEYIVGFHPQKYERHDINILAGVILSVTLLSIAPKLINDKEKLIELGWIES